MRKMIGVFKIVTNVCDGVFLQNIVDSLRPVTVFSKSFITLNLPAAMRILSRHDYLMYNWIIRYNIM